MNDMECAALVEEHQPLLARLARSQMRLSPWVELDDLVSAGELVLFKAARQFDSSRDDFRSWVAFRVFRELRETCQERGSRETSCRDRNTRTEPSPGAQVDRISRQRRPNVVSIALGRLPELQRDVLTARYFHGESVAEISERLHLSRRSVGVLCRDGLNRIRCAPVGD